MKRVSLVHEFENVTGENKLSKCNFWIVFQIKCKLINFFIFKDKILLFSRFGIVYKFKCGCCNDTYLGKTKRHFKVRMCENLGVSTLTGMKVKGDNDFAIKEHNLLRNHLSGFDDFSILAGNNNDFKVTLMERLLINRDHPPLNNNRHSLLLELFDDWGTYFYYMMAMDWSDCGLLIPYEWYFKKYMFFKANGVRLRNEVVLYNLFNWLFYLYIKFRRRVASDLHSFLMLSFQYITLDILPTTICISVTVH